jgi:hypothetical protein
MHEWEWDWFVIMTGPSAAAELRTSNDGGLKNFLNPGKDWIWEMRVLRSSEVLAA